MATRVSKFLPPLFVGIAALSLAIPAMSQSISGPIVNDANGHTYHLLASKSWTASEAEAVALGGHLVTINDQAEQDWVYSTFSQFGGISRSLWIGLNDSATEGTFVWASGEAVTFTRWSPGEPNSGEGFVDEDYGEIFAPVDSRGGYWNDGADNVPCTPACYGVVEIGQSVTFSFVGHAENWIVPPGVTSVRIDARGAQGGGNPSTPTPQGGKGGRVQTTLNVPPGETLVITVGGRGGDLSSPNIAGPGGFNGGGRSGIDNVDFNGPAGGGGGASDVRQGGSDLVHRVVVAGGGGGAECCSGPSLEGTGAPGGEGGGLTGGQGGSFGFSTPGGGGGQSSGGLGGTGCNGNGTSGSLGQGGIGGDGNRAGGGGGGGYYGGGGGGGCLLGSGGGGGSSYSAGTNTTHTQGFQTGHGQVIISYGAPSTPDISSNGVPSNSNRQGRTQEPISTGNGNFYHQHTDVTIPGRGLSLAFQRTHNALDNYTGPLGANWTHSHNVTLTEAASSVTIRWGDGHGETFTLSGASYLPPPGVFSILTKNPDNTFVLSQKNQTEFAFSVAGKLTHIEDKNGNSILLSYDSGGKLTQITDTVGRNLTFTNDADGRITQVADPIGRTVRFQYDASNNLTQVTDQAGGITTYAYDSNHRITSITQPNGQLLLSNIYDASGRAISQTGGRGFSAMLEYDTPSPGETTITDARGKESIHTYDSSLRIIEITDADGGTIAFDYDSDNNRTSVTNQNSETTHFAYDARGNVTSITDPLSNVTSFTYDAENNLLTATNAKGKTTTFSYDGAGNLTSILDALGTTTTFAYNGFGQLTSKTDARGNTTAYLYDAQGNLTRITNALGHKTNLAYDGIGRLTSITDPNSRTATATYDALSRLTRITDPLGNQTQFLYDAIGNLLRVTDAKGNATNYAYDAANNLTRVTDALGHITQYAYDENNNRTTFTNAKGIATSYLYDDLNRLTGIIDPLSFVTSYSYDPVGNVQAVTDAKGQTNQFTYDALNRLLTIAYADGKNAAYAYDVNSNRTSMADSHGTTTYSYDDLDRLTSVTHPGPKVVAYSYDAVGNRTTITYPDGKAVTYSYDAANRLSSARDWLARNTTYTYDAASKLRRTTYPNGTNIAFSYDAANRLTRVVNTLKNLPAITIAYMLDAVGNRTTLSVNGVTTKFTYDDLNQLLGAQLGPLKTTWTYDPVGNRIREVAPLRRVTTYSYDAADRLLQANTAVFTYDANGNMTSRTQTASGSPIVYQYDAANRLIAALGGGVNSSFAYDGDGNRVRQSVGAGTYNYVNDVATALPVVVQESGPDGNISYAYGLGLISESSPAFNYFYHHDGLGSVIALSDTFGKPRVAYVYDAWGNPLLSVPNSVGTKNKFRFSGEALDPGTGLYYLRARYYDPTVGRFTKRDPFPGNPWFPSTFQSYNYALNNPVLNTDPFGLSPSLSLQNYNSTIPFAPPPPPAPPQPTPEQEKQIQAQFEELLREDQLLRDCGGDTYCTTVRRQQLLQTARWKVLGQNAPRPSAGEIISELILLLSYALSGIGAP